MQTQVLISEILNLPIDDRITIIKQAIDSIQSDVSMKKINTRKAAELLLDDYHNNKELTAFTAIDSEDFYEAI
jgi:putative addiction module component (TIGR02574 family)